MMGPRGPMMAPRGPSVSNFPCSLFSSCDLTNIRPSLLFSCSKDAWARQFQQQQRAAPVRPDHIMRGEVICVRPDHLWCRAVVCVSACSYGSRMGVPTTPERDGGGMANATSASASATRDGMEGSATEGYDNAVGALVGMMT